MEPATWYWALEGVKLREVFSAKLQTQLLFFVQTTFQSNIQDLGFVRAC